MHLITPFPVLKDVYLTSKAWPRTHRRQEHTFHVQVLHCENDVSPAVRPKPKTSKTPLPTSPRQGRRLSAPASVPRSSRAIP